MLAAAVLASSMGFIDGTVVSIAMPAIRATLGATLGEATWINNAYMVALSALILSGGAVADRYGLARVFAWGIGIFVVTSLACALAPTPDILIVARAAQGVGAALMVPGSLAIVSRAHPREERGRAIGLWAGFAALTTALGPVIGGGLLWIGGDAAWRAIFAINLPLGIVALWMLRRGVHVDESHPEQPVDVWGAVLAALGLGALAWALAGAESSAEGGVQVSVAAGGVLLLAAFVWRQHVARYPMMPLELFRSSTFSAANAATFLLYFGLSAILFYLPMLIIAGWDVPEILAILAFAPLSIFIATLSTRFGRLADRIGAGHLIGTGASIAAIAFAWLALAVPGGAFWTGALPPMVLMGLGMSMVVAPLSTAVMGAVGDGRASIASGINNALSRIGGLVAVAAMGSVAGVVYARAGGPMSYGLPSDAAGHAAAMEAGMAAVAWVCAGLAAAAAVLAWAGVRKG
ncbi:MAG: MFS transporter [Paracoccaceae bacterium]